MKKSFIKCPLCWEKVFHSTQKRDTDIVHTWICSACPFIWFEFYGNTDVEILKEKLITPEDEEKKKLNNQLVWLMLLFKPVNERINVWDPMQRNILKWMLKVMSYEEAKDMIEYAVSIQGKEYAPTVTCPSDLRYKQDKINNYAERNK